MTTVDVRLLFVFIMDDKRCRLRYYLACYCRRTPLPRFVRKFHAALG